MAVFYKQRPLPDQKENPVFDCLRKLANSSFSRKYAAIKVRRKRRCGMGKGINKNSPVILHRAVFMLVG